MYNKKKYKKSRVNTDYYQMCCSYNKKIQNVVCNECKREDWTEFMNL